MMKRFISVVLATLMMALMLMVPLSTVSFAASSAHAHPVCAGTCSGSENGATCGHTNYQWKPWDGTTRLYDGYYYLTKDLVFKGRFIINSGIRGSDVYLCLNGHSITSEDTVFDVYSNDNLTITDCVGTGKVETVAKAVNDNYYPDTIVIARKFTLWNGAIKNSNGYGDAILGGRPANGIPSVTTIYGGEVEGIHLVNYTHAYIYGGKIESDRVAVYMQTGANCYVYGGVINSRNSYAVSSIGTTGSLNTSLLNISGGTITGAFRINTGDPYAVNLTMGRLEMSGGYIGGYVGRVYDLETGSVNRGAINKITGGTIEGYISISGGTTTITGGEFFGGSRINITSGDVKISGGTFGSPTCCLGGSDVDVSVTGGSFKAISMDSGNLYLSGKPAIEKLYVKYPGSVSATEADGWGAYTGDKIQVVTTGSEWHNEVHDTVIVKNVYSDETAEKFVCDNSSYPWYDIKRSGNNIVRINHNFEVEFTDYTCTQGAYNTYICQECDFSFIEGPTEPLGHNYVVTETVAPDCDNTGYTVYKCSRCSDSYTDRVAALGHTYTSVVTTPATHTSAGTRTYTCACGDYYTRSIPKLADEHSYTSQLTKQPTHLEEGLETFTCECGHSYTKTVDKLAEHTYTSTVTKEPTHLETGNRNFYCECGDSYDEAIPKTKEHSYYISEIVTPTCEKDGYTVYVCECGKSYKDDHMSKLGHDYNGDTCKNCGRSRVENCSHMCHKSGLMGFIWKIINFFNKLFKSNKTCACGVAHY